MILFGEDSIVWVDVEIAAISSRVFKFLSCRKRGGPLSRIEVLAQKKNPSLLCRMA